MIVVVEKVSAQQAFIDVLTLPFAIIEGLWKILLQFFVRQDLEVILSFWRQQILSFDSFRNLMRHSLDVELTILQACSIDFKFARFNKQIELE